MSASKLIRRYTRAVFDLAVEQRLHERVGRELDQLAGAVTRSEALREVLRSPRVPADARRKVVDTLLRRMFVCRLTQNFVHVLLDRHRMLLLPDIARAYRRLLDARAGRVRAEVATAAPLDAATRTRVREVLRKAFDARDVQLEVHVRPELLGGLVARVGHMVVDGSVRSRLDAMREHLLRGRAG